MIRTRLFVRLCPACPMLPDMGACPALSGMSGHAVKAMKYNENIRNRSVSASCPDKAARRIVDRTRRGNGFPPLGGEPSHPRDTPGAVLSVRARIGGAA
ncbi:hypothetical protein SAMN05877831_10389 [Rhodobacter maris]|uniref:Uncharacterized protein n=1 Tax=Rhodobacter maris TaxID=446682 RepID=A0A285S663_9RHOB|nr:hypothetical protein SAMN05877831_10389 [Rhodobacter maris]